MKSISSFILLVFVLISTGCQNGQTPIAMQYGAVSSASPEASKAGMEILRLGGNAVDAAIAISFVLGVTEPAMSGIGGGTQVIMKLPDKIPFSINGSTLSPNMTPQHWTKDSLTKHKRTTVPSTVKVMDYLYQNYASKKMSWSQLIQPAIDYTDSGFKFGDFRMKVFERYREKLNRAIPNTSNYIADSTGSINHNPALNKSLKIIAEDGPDAFYKGEIAESISQDMIKHDGWIRLEDLQNFPYPSEVSSVHFKYKGYDVYTQPEPCGGWVVKEILEELARLEQSSVEQDLRVLIARAIHHGHKMRKTLASEQYDQGETTHFSVIDKDGITLSVTSSINAYYGAGIANTNYGFLYNSYMDDFIYDEPQNKYAVGPNKMAYSSMSPTIVVKDGEIKMVIGSPGSARIISTVAQLVAYYCNDTYDPNSLHKIPRIHAYDGKILVESDDWKDLFGSEIERGMDIVEANKSLMMNDLNPYFGGVHAIVKTKDGYIPLADVRRDGLALIE